jgi:hypothetical protein
MPSYWLLAFGLCSQSHWLAHACATAVAIGSQVSGFSPTAERAAFIGTSHEFGSSAPPSSSVPEPLELPELEPLELPELEPLELPELEPLEPPELDPLEPPELEPLDPPELEPLEPPELDPLELPEPPREPLDDPELPPLPPDEELPELPPLLELPAGPAGDVPEPEQPTAQTMRNCASDRRPIVRLSTARWDARRVPIGASSPRGRDSGFMHDLRILPR